MPIRVTCQCGQQFAAKDELAGRRVKCPKCQAVLTIPQPGAVAAGAGKSLSQLLDDVGMRAGVRRCPGCGAEMAEAAILCVMCGYDTRLGHRRKIRVNAEVVIDDEDLGDLPTHGHPTLDAAERQLARDKLEQARLSTGAPWWMLLIAFIGLVGFAVSMVSMPQERVMENSGRALQIAGGGLIVLYYFRLLFVAFSESAMHGVMCLILPPLYLVTRWDRVASIVIFMGIGAAVLGAGFGLLHLAPLFQGGDSVGVLNLVSPVVPGAEIAVLGIGV